MNPSFVHCGKLALYAGAFAGPASAVSLVLMASFHALHDDPVSVEPLALLSVVAVGLFIGTIVAVVAGFPVFLLLQSFQGCHPAVVAVWSAVLGAGSYHWFFMSGSSVSLEWLATGALSGLLAGGSAAVLLGSSRRSVNGSTYIQQ